MPQIMLSPGVNVLAAGQVYALPNYPCQILNNGEWIYYSPVSGSLPPASEIYYEPGKFVIGGFIRADNLLQIVLKKHIIGPIPTAVNYESAIMMDKPSYYWTLNESSGARAYERIQQVEGTISGGVTLFQPGIAGKAMVFDGVSGQILTAGNVTIPVTVTFEAWIKPSVAMTGAPNIPYLTIGSPIYIGVASGILFYQFSGINLMGPIITDGQWHHCVGVFDGITGSIYVDGKLFGSSSYIRSTIISAPAMFARYTTAGTDWWNGSIDEVAIYPYALSAAQIQSHYLARYNVIPDSYPAKVLASQPSNYWRLGELSGTVAKDEVGGVNGTINGGVTLGQSGIDGSMYFDGTIASTAISMVGVSLPLICTIEGWIKPTYLISHHAMFSTRGTTTNGFLFGIRSPGWISCYSDNSTPVEIVHPTTVILNTWNHIVFIRNGTTVTIYLNGIPFTAPQTHVALSSVSARISDAGQGNVFHGFIDEVAIYPKALTPAEILDHYNAGKR